jgi:hypothetical protein
MNKYLSDTITEQVKRTVLVPANFTHTVTDDDRIFKETTFRMLDTDTIRATKEFASGDVCILNFASYKNPGGFYLGGSPAQEEFICHYSTLYPVLLQFRKVFYDRHQSSLNNGLYTSELLFSSDITLYAWNDENLVSQLSVTHDSVTNMNLVAFDMSLMEQLTYEEKKSSAVITCAAPNAGTARRYKRVTELEIYESLYDRINKVLCTAFDKHQKNLILGAFGCGVFQNNAVDVAQIFIQLLTTTYKGCFQEIVFAIPRDKTHNYEIFERLLEGKGII